MNERGFTLLEVIVAIMLMAIMTTIAIMSVQSANELDDHAHKLQAAARAMFDEASVKDVTLRLAYDMDEGAWWVEAYEGTFQISGTARDNADVAREKEEKEAERRRLKEKYGSDAPGADPVKEFVQVGGVGFVEPQVLPPNIRFVSVDTPQLQEPVTKGKAYTHFFPGGFAEPTIIVIADINNPDDRTDDRFKTLEMEPMTGHLVIHDGKMTREDIEKEREREG